MAWTRSLDARPRSVRFACLALLILFGATGRDALAASGTDGGGGYRWRDSGDGATPPTATHDALTTTISPGDNAAPTAVPLGFNFPYYGGTYPTAWVSDNGWISFVDPAGNSYPTNSPIPTAGGLEGFIAPFWTDLLCTPQSFGLRITHGPVVALSAYMFEVVATEPATGINVAWRLYLYQSGVIQIFYVVPGSPLIFPTIGIENPTGTDGIQINYGSTQHPGVPASIPPDYVIEIEPPPLLPVICASLPIIGCPTTQNDGLPGAQPGFVARYGCDLGPWNARERIYGVTLANAGRLTATLTPGSGTNLALFLLETCNERQCVLGPVTSIDVFMTPGTYYLVVDAPAQTDEGTFTLDVGCSPVGAPLACGTTVSGDTTGGQMLFPSYPCAGGTDLSGPERFYEVTVAAPTNIRATLSGTTIHDVLVLDANGASITPRECLDWGDTEAFGWYVQPGTYMVVVDGIAGASGPFTLNVECSTELTCGATSGTIDFGTGGRVQILLGDTTGGADVVERYGCRSDIVFDGPERIYELVLPQPGQVVVFQTEGAAGLSFFILSTCDEGACLGAKEGQGCGGNLDAGTYYLVVDGEAGASGTFEARIAFEEQFNRWSECELPFGNTSIDDTVSNFWHLSDNAFCIQNQNSVNFPFGCIFAMYIVVQCGTSIHVPLYDVEGGHLRIFDVFNGDYVNLTAESTGGWSMSGTEIQWQDADCQDGSDARWNEQTTDIWFARNEGVCGIFRLEFINHSGNVWELFTNCTGQRTGVYNIHDSLCSALGEFDPLPNLSLEAVSAVANCPTIDITYEVRNDGCGLARNIPIQLYDGLTLVGQTILPEAPYGTTTVGTFSATFTTLPTATLVRVYVDQADDILECFEAGVACNPNQGAEYIDIPGCIGGCLVQAGALANPTSICAGDLVEVDARGSASSDCASGVLEYQLSDAAGNVVRPFQLSSVFSNLAPALTTTYTVTVQCQGNTNCNDTETVTIDVERPPTFNPLSVQAVDISDCQPGIRVTWAPATFHGPTGLGAYNVYRSEVSCADALTLPPVDFNRFNTSFTDPDTVGGVTYYYVVEAEDGTPAQHCQPRGPINTGAVTRVDASGGTCTPITDVVVADVAALPKVGPTLRAGGSYPGPPLILRYGQSFVDLEWSTDVPIDQLAGEHFHVFRSEAPQRATFVQIAEPPVTINPLWTDVNAGDTVGNTGTHVWHYLVFVSNDCEQDNRDEPGA